MASGRRGVGVGQRQRGIAADPLTEPQAPRRERGGREPYRSAQCHDSGRSTGTETLETHGGIARGRPGGGARCAGRPRLRGREGMMPRKALSLARSKFSFRSPFFWPLKLDSGKSQSWGGSSRAFPTAHPRRVSPRLKRAPRCVYTSPRASSSRRNAATGHGSNRAATRRSPRFFVTNANHE